MADILVDEQLVAAAPVAWGDVVGVLVRTLGHDFEVVEHEDGRCQFGDYATGIRAWFSDGRLLLSAAYALQFPAAHRLAETMRDLAFEIETVTGSTALAARFAQPELMQSEMAGRERVHGYAVGFDADVSGDMTLPASLLVQFDRAAALRNSSR